MWRQGERQREGPFRRASLQGLPVGDARPNDMKNTSHAGAIATTASSRAWLHLQHPPPWRTRIACADTSDVLTSCLTTLFIRSARSGRDPSRPISGLLRKGRCRAPCQVQIDDRRGVVGRTSALSMCLPGLDSRQTMPFQPVEANSRGPGSRCRRSAIINVVSSGGCRP